MVKSVKKFPTFAIIVLVIAVIWLVSDLGYLRVNVPWIPVILIIASIGWIMNRYSE